MLVCPFPSSKGCNSIVALKFYCQEGQVDPALSLTGLLHCPGLPLFPGSLLSSLLVAQPVEAPAPPCCRGIPAGIRMLLPLESGMAQMALEQPWLWEHPPSP